MRREIYSKIEIEGIHNWKSCPIEEVSYLRDDHRHIFHIKVFKNVTHSDRDIEFIQFKHQIIDYLNTSYFESNKKCLYFGSMSCEMIAEELINEFDLLRCEVSEDDENGVIVYKD